MKSVMAIVLIGIFVFVSGVAMAQQHPSDLSIAYSCRKASNSCFMTKYRPVPGDVLTLTIRILNGMNHQSSSLTVTLFNRSNYVGHYINSVSGSIGYDMQFQDLAWHQLLNPVGLTWSKGSESLYEGGRESLTVQWNNMPPSTIKIYIDISDGAAFANFSAQLYRHHSSFGFSIPWDYSPQNGIADSFDERYTDADRSGTADNETGPGMNPNHGDGLTYFEEYRGAMLKDIWRPLDPRKKEYFIYSDFYGPPPNKGRMGTKGYEERTLRIDAKPTGFAGNLPSVFRGYLVNEDEILNRVINFRDTGHSRMAQEAIVILEEPFPTEEDAKAWIMSTYNDPTGEVLGIAQVKTRDYSQCASGDETVPDFYGVLTSAIDHEKSG